MLYGETDKAFVRRSSCVVRAYVTNHRLTKETKKRSQVIKGADRIGGVINGHTLKRRCDRRSHI
jgi:hypothetical protein